MPHHCKDKVVNAVQGNDLYLQSVGRMQSLDVKPGGHRVITVL